MKVSYYPGCTLKSKAKNLDESAVAAMAALGVEMEELPRWNCCGAVHSLADDDLIHHVAPVRDLIRAKEQGAEILVTLCSMCYNSLARANLIMRDDEEKRRTINLFMDEEIDYQGEVEVVHLLGFLDQRIGWSTIREAVKVPLRGMVLAPYYGCTLQRPRDVAMEPPGSFQMMRRLLEALGSEVVHFPAADLCCGSYQILAHPEAAESSSAVILQTAVQAGADALVLSCPLCDFNLGKRQASLLEQGRIEKEVPVFYFTQLFALALGVSPDLCHLELNTPSCISLLKQKGYPFDLDEAERV